MSLSDDHPQTAEVSEETLESIRDINWPVRVFGSRDGPGISLAGCSIQPGDYLVHNARDDGDVQLVLRAGMGPVVVFSDTRTNYIAYNHEFLSEDLISTVQGTSETPRVQHVPRSKVHPDDE
jgi:hypothetical protein